MPLSLPAASAAKSASEMLMVQSAFGPLPLMTPGVSLLASIVQDAEEGCKIEMFSALFVAPLMLEAMEANMVRRDLVIAFQRSFNSRPFLGLLLAFRSGLLSLSRLL